MCVLTRWVQWTVFRSIRCENERARPLILLRNTFYLGVYQAAINESGLHDLYERGIHRNGLPHLCITVDSYHLLMSEINDSGTNIFVACEAAHGLGWMSTRGKNTRPRAKSIFVDYNCWSYKDIVNTKTNETSNNINPENTCINL